MPGAHVESIEALTTLRAALLRFAESVRAGLAEAEGELDRIRHSLRVEWPAYWNLEIGRRTEAVVRAREALRSKKGIRRHDGSRPSAIEEERALAAATARVEQARAKIEKVHRCSLLLEKQEQLYKSRMQRFQAVATTGVPEAVAFLDKVIARLEEYGGPGISSADSPPASPPPSDEPSCRPEPAENTPADEGRNRKRE